MIERICIANLFHGLMCGDQMFLLSRIRVEKKRTWPLSGFNERCEILVYAPDYHHVLLEKENSMKVENEKGNRCIYIVFCIVLFIMILRVNVLQCLHLYYYLI